jgi:hypothetical protein
VPLDKYFARTVSILNAERALKVQFSLNVWVACAAPR